MNPNQLYQCQSTVFLVKTSLILKNSLHIDHNSPPHSKYCQGFRFITKLKNWRFLIILASKALTCAAGQEVVGWCQFHQLWSGLNFCCILFIVYCDPPWSCFALCFFFAVSVIFKVPRGKFEEPKSHQLLSDQWW